MCQVSPALRVVALLQRPVIVFSALDAIDTVAPDMAIAPELVIVSVFVSAKYLKVYVPAEGTFNV